MCLKHEQCIGPPYQKLKNSTFYQKNGSEKDWKLENLIIKAQIYHKCHQSQKLKPSDQGSGLVLYLTFSEDKCSVW